MIIRYLLDRSFTDTIMNMKTILIFLLLSIYISLAHGQKSKTILSAPDNWNSEIIPFPLGFAPEIDFVGFEDIRFAPGRSDSTSIEFWTYHFTWFIDKVGPMTEDLLSETLTTYYDGLMKAVEGQSDDLVNDGLRNKPVCLFIKTDEGITGKMKVKETFFTKDYITLNVKVKQSICQESNKLLISFDISPRGFDDKVWGLFESVQVTGKCE